MQKRKRTTLLRSFVAAAAVSATTFAGTITNDLIVHLTFDDTYADSSTRQNNGEPIGTPSFVAGKVGKAVSLRSMKDGSDFTYVSLGAAPDLDFGGFTDFTISMWVKVNNNEGDPAFIGNKNWGSGGNTGWIVATDGDGRLQWNYRESEADRKDYDGSGGTFSDHNWHHVAVAFTRTNAAVSFVDGARVNSTGIAPAAETLNTSDVGYMTNIGQDGTGTYTDGGGVSFEGLIDDVGVWRRALSDSEVNRIFNAGLTGVNLANTPDPKGATVSLASPANGITNASPSAMFNATIVDATTKLVSSSVKVTFDGNPVTPTVTPSGTNANTITARGSSGLLEAGSSHTWQLIFTDNGSPAVTTTNTYSFKVGSYVNFALPTPLYFEDFETTPETPEGSIPTGWTAVNHTGDLTAGFDLKDPESDSYKGWLVITRDTVKAASWGADNRLNAKPNQLVNGVEVTSLLQGSKYIYAESDNRDGSQVQYLTTPDYNLSGKSNIYVVYYSTYTQNQDNINALEYSIDQGTTWLPIVYMINGKAGNDDIFYLEDGTTIDAVTTLTQSQGDSANYTDPDTGEFFGGTYGAFIGAEITQDLAPYISPRIDDDQTESKRIEQFRVVKADGQAKVRFRFLQAGTGSWFWGIDNFGIYSIGAQAAELKIASFARLGTAIQLNLTGGTPPFLVQKKASLSDANWVNVMTTSDRQVQVLNDGGNGFFRVSDQATGNIQAFTAVLNGANERATPVTTAGTGLAGFSLNGNDLTFRILYQGLSGTATAAHIHGPADTATATGVMVNFANFAVGGFGASGVFQGTVTLTADQKTALLAGKTYFNIHTVANGGGEIRGQILPVQFKADLNGANERPNPVTTSATGSAKLWVVGTQGTFDINYSGLTGTATAAHFHGPADANGTASPVIDLSKYAVGTGFGASGRIAGTVVLTQDQINALIDGKVYANIHTVANGGGEIRGQVTPAP